MSEQTTIMVRLVEEGVEVFRPVFARHVRGDVYLITDQPYDHESERWEFEPGSEVICESSKLEGEEYMLAKRYS